VWTDLRGIIDPKRDPKTHDVLKSAYLVDKIIDGKKVILDYGLIHEWFHELFNLPDEYIMDITPGNPSFVMVGDGLGSEGLLLRPATRRTPFIAWYLKQIEKLNVRGYFRDERGVGIAVNQEGKGSVNDILGLHPKNVTIALVDFNFRPVSGRIRPVKLQTRYDYYTSEQNPKIPMALPEQSLVNGHFQLTPDYFKPRRIIDSETLDHFIYYPTNWYFEVEADNGIRYRLHFPSAPLIMSGLAGKTEDATYTIHLYNQNIYFDTQYLEMATLAELGQVRQGAPQPYASTQVDGTDDYLLWFNI